ncbi:MAG TPA: methylenetetrahydrofolate reductase [Xanthobacteraceae bacterium]|jgi:methylenetetrahydrofolate reductase (NADPH)
MMDVAASVSSSPPGARQIADFLQDFSLDATRPSASDIESLRGVLNPGCKVYITAVARRPQQEVIGAARLLRTAGFEPVPHIAAHNFTDAGDLNGFLATLSREANVRTVLVIGGDGEHSTGAFNTAIDVIDSGLLQRHGIEEIGIGGYPEGHPRFSVEALDLALKAKIEAAEQTGLRVHIVTQFCFATLPVLQWISRTRDLGVEHPIRIGLAGPTSLTTLLRFARRCGVLNSAQGLTRQAGMFKHLIGTSAPDTIIRELAEMSRDRLGDVSTHLFTFGGLAATARWAQAAASGSVVLDAAGFRVEALNAPA